MIKGVEHIGLCAVDPEMLVDWYARTLGFTIVRALEEHRTYFVRSTNGGMLEVYPAKHPTDPVDNVHRGLRHIALSASDVDAEITRLRSAGVGGSRRDYRHHAGYEACLLPGPGGKPSPPG